MSATSVSRSRTSRTGVGQDAARGCGPCGEERTLAGQHVSSPANWPGPWRASSTLRPGASLLTTTSPLSTTSRSLLSSAGEYKISPAVTRRVCRTGAAGPADCRPAPGRRSPRWPDRGDWPAPFAARARRGGGCAGGWQHGHRVRRTPACRSMSRNCMARLPWVACRAMASRPIGRISPPRESPSAGERRVQRHRGQQAQRGAGPGERLAAGQVGDARRPGTAARPPPVPRPGRVWEARWPA